MSTTTHELDWIVCKFGGSSVATAPNWEKISRTLQKHLNQHKRVVLVCSALKGVTNLLEAAIDGAASQAGADAQVAQISAKHFDLASELGLNGIPILKDYLNNLERDLEACSKQGALPRLRARIMAYGEMMSTQLGAAFLKKRGLPATWRDARDMLTATSLKGHRKGARYYLGAQCNHNPDRSLQAELSESGPLHVTQGFIVKTPEGETALLGRGGSDTSAAYLAARLEAERLEIWTDVPGMFTANPHRVSNARLIRSLGYEGAKALATTGAKVLHPRCVAPAHKNGIPIYIKCTSNPEIPGTIIGPESDNDASPALHALTARSGLFLMRTGTDQKDPMAVLANLTGQIRDHGLLVDSCAINNSQIQTVIDPMLSPIEDHEMDALVTQLNQTSRTEVETEISSLSLVGPSPNELYTDLGVVMNSLDHQRLRSLGNTGTQDITLFLDHGKVDDLVSDMHGLLLEKSDSCDYFGPTWQEIQGVMNRVPLLASA